MDNVNTPNHRPFFFWSQNSNNSISFPISNKMYITKHTIDSIKDIVLKIILVLSNWNDSQELWLVKINIVMLKRRHFFLLKNCKRGKPDQEDCIKYKVNKVIHFSNHQVFHLYKRLYHRMFEKICLWIFKNSMKFFLRKQNVLKIDITLINPQFQIYFSHSSID